MPRIFEMAAPIMLTLGSAAGLLSAAGATDADAAVAVAYPPAALSEAGARAVATAPEGWRLVAITVTEPLPVLIFARDEDGRQAAARSADLRHRTGGLFAVGVLARGVCLSRG